MVGSTIRQSPTSLARRGVQWAGSISRKVSAEQTACSSLLTDNPVVEVLDERGLILKKEVLDRIKARQASVQIVILNPQHTFGTQRLGVGNARPGNNTL
jgi:hypothetical protein